MTDQQTPDPASETEAERSARFERDALPFHLRFLQSFFLLLHVLRVGLRFIEPSFGTEVLERHIARRKPPLVIELHSFLHVCQPTLIVGR